MENNKTEEKKAKNINFFKLVWYSITKFEKYPEMAAMGLKRVFIYFTELMLIFSVICIISFLYLIQNNHNDEGLTKLTEQLFSKYEINEEDKEVLVKKINNINSSNSDKVVLSVSFFIAIYFTTLLDVVMLSAFGIFTCLLARIRMKYKAIFNMSIFALTLSIFLRIIYTVVTMFTEFEIKYFYFMYRTISYIILAAAIFMIKSDIVKQQLQLMNIIEKSKEKIEQTIKIPKNEPEDKNEDKDKDKKESDKKENTPKDTEEEQGSNA